MSTFVRGAGGAQNYIADATNVVIGSSALGGGSLRTNNTVLGAGAGINTAADGNVILGCRAGMGLGIGSFGVFIGQEAAGVADGGNQISIGNAATCTAASQITLGNSSVTALRCKVTSISSLSDRRTKEEYFPADTAICYEDMKRLPVHRFKYKNFTGTNIDEHKTGFMADDVEQVFPKCVHVADQWFPMLDEAGEPVMETAVNEETGEEYERPRKFLMKDVKEIAVADQALVTLWGAVQHLAAKVEALEARAAAGEE